MGLVGPQKRCLGLKSSLAWMRGTDGSTFKATRNHVAPPRPVHSFLLAFTNTLSVCFDGQLLMIKGDPNIWI